MNDICFVWSSRLYPRRLQRLFLCLSVCLSICLSVYPHDISQTAAARIIKLDIEMFNYPSRNSCIIYFWEKFKSQGHKSQKAVPAWVFALLWVLASSSLFYFFFCLSLLLLLWYCSYFIIILSASVTVFKKRLRRTKDDWIYSSTLAITSSLDLLDHYFTSEVDVCT